MKGTQACLFLERAFDKSRGQHMKDSSTRTVLPAPTRMWPGRGFLFCVLFVFLGDEGNNPRSGRPTWPMAAPPISKAAYRGALVPSLSDPGSACHSGHGPLLSPRHSPFQRLYPTACQICENAPTSHIKCNFCYKIFQRIFIIPLSKLFAYE